MFLFPPTSFWMRQQIFRALERLFHSFWPSFVYKHIEWQNSRVPRGEMGNGEEDKPMVAPVSPMDGKSASGAKRPKGRWRRKDGRDEAGAFLLVRVVIHRRKSSHRKWRGNGRSKGGDLSRQHTFPWPPFCLGQYVKMGWKCNVWIVVAAAFVFTSHSLSFAIPFWRKIRRIWPKWYSFFLINLLQFFTNSRMRLLCFHNILLLLFIILPPVIWAVGPRKRKLPWSEFRKNN